MNRRTRLAWAWAAAALLTACGGGGGGGDDGPTSPGALAAVPDSANASAAAYTAFTASVVDLGAGADTAAPLRMNPSDAPTSEQAAPAAVR